MSETRTAPTPQPEDRSRLRRLFWIVPVLTFVAGLLLGGGVIAAMDLGDDERAGVSAEDGQAGEATASPIPEGDSTITVPASCAEGLDRAQLALEAAESGVTALRELDTARLQKVFDDLQRIQPEVTRLARACRAAAADGD